jgi:DNA polymerase III subunit delta
MVAVRAQNADSFLAAPERGVGAVLLFGTDAGLVAERAQRLAQAQVARETPPGEIVRLDEPELDQDPDRLAVELLTVPMFGGRKIVRTAAGRRVNAQTLKPLLEGAPFSGFLIVEAGNLRPDDALRNLFEKSPRAAGVPCYPDDVRDLSGMIDEIVGAAGLTIAPEARQQLAARLGADRGLSRSEVDKLVLYAAGKGTIEIEDIEAIVGDAAEQAMDRLVNAAALGNGGSAVIECDRAVAAGESPQAIIAAMQRHFMRLHRTRAAMDQGRTLDDLIRQMRPPLHFKQRQAFETQCRRWTSARLQAALSLIAMAAKAARLNPALETALAERLMLDLVSLSADPRATGARR